MSGTQTLQVAQLSCLNEDIAANDVQSFVHDLGPDSILRSRYMQVGGLWTLPGKKLGPIGSLGSPGKSIASADRKGIINLANTTMDTWMQKKTQILYCENNCDGTHTANSWTQTDCFGCHKTDYETSASVPTAELPKEGHVDFSHLLERIVDSSGGVSDSCASTGS